MSIYFSEQRWPELKKAIEKDSLIVLPVGQVEEHGPHLPLETDYRISVEACKRAVEKTSRDIPVLLMPGIWSGYSIKEVARWPGVIRVQPETLIALIFDICSSLVEMGFRKIVTVNSHGQHTGILEIVTRKIGDKYGVHMAAIETYTLGSDTVARIRKSKPGGCGHAGEVETSLMLYLTDLVDMTKVSSIDHCRYESKFKPLEGSSTKGKAYWSTWATEKSRTGVLGDPTMAEEEAGRKIMEAIVNELTDFLIEYYRFKKPK